MGALNDFIGNVKYYVKKNLLFILAFLYFLQ